MYKALTINHGLFAFRNTIKCVELSVYLRESFALVSHAETDNIPSQSDPGASHRRISNQSF